MPLPRVGARTNSTTSYSYNARRGQLPRTRIGIVHRTRARHAVCAEGLHFSAFHCNISYVNCSSASICAHVTEVSYVIVGSVARGNLQDQVVSLCEHVHAFCILYTCPA